MLQNMPYQRLNNLTGWGVFFTTAIVYLLTMSPTASFWDCGEFIACANELEVTHPPGAPLFLLLGRIFSIFSFGDVTLIAFMVNLLSALASAFTALFTCWTTTMLAQKGLRMVTWGDQTRNIGALAAGVVAGLTCAFADSVWFNAVEAEVYALSSFFTAIVVWLMFKWEARADEPNHWRWLILIAYLMGLSIGVHLLNLLTVPALALLFYYRKFDFSWLGLTLTMGISVAVLAFLQYGIIQETFQVAWVFERFFTGTVGANGMEKGGLGMPVGTGMIIWFGLIVLVIVGLLYLSQQKKWIALNTSMLALTVVLLGFSSYAMIFVRSNANPPVDMNNPENVLTFLSYMRREQYGDRPLVRGPLYNGQIKRDSRGAALYDVKGQKYILSPDKGQYIEDVEDIEYQYRDNDIVWFPRMWSRDRYASGSFGYINFVENKGSDQRNPADDRPTKAEDWKFFFTYQLNHMYFRYFLWNFVGRSSDVQDDGWEDGLFRSTALRADNKAHNHYYFLPLLMGLLGFIWQFSQRPRDAAVVGMLFFFTGIAIIIYLNQYPAQPRERDYSFAGSFQTFAIWAGLGVLFWIEFLRKYLGNMALWVSIALALSAPFVMLVQNWDDHTRAGRWVDIEFGKNLLDSCEKNGILFTGGDNDTFPLWYVQEVEGYRTDVRVVNLELLISDWYIDNMRMPHNGAEPVPISLKSEDYAGEKGLFVSNFPARDIILPYQKEDLLQNGVVTEDELPLLSSTGEMVWKFRPRGSSRNPYILRKDQVLINIMQNVAKDGWKRPIYFANSMGGSSFLNLSDYFRMEGLAYRVVPIQKSSKTPNDIYFGWVSQERMETTLRSKLAYTGLDDPSVNHDEHIRQVIIGNYRNCFIRLANTYGDQIVGWTAENRALIDSMKNGKIAQDTAQAIINKNNQQITYAQGKVVELLNASEEKMPSSVVEKPMNLHLTEFQLLDRANLKDAMVEQLNRMVPYAMGQVEGYTQDNIPIDNRNLAMRGVLLGIQFIKNIDQAQAEAWANELYDRTGNGVGLQLLQQQ
ncbi:MAG: DUF2723 domain-containing protein [Bacteroidota bacterium]